MTTNTRIVNSQTSNDKLCRLNSRKSLFTTNDFITREQRERKNKHKSFVLWLTGLSGAGKSTIAKELEKAIFSKGFQVRILDGDDIRESLNSDLDYSKNDRKENLRRVKEVSKLFLDTGIITICAFISPYSCDRDVLRKYFSRCDFIEIYIKCSLEECERRDPKGIYKKARVGIIKGLTGIDAPYEAPKNPEITISTENLSVEESVELVLDYLEYNRILSQNTASLSIK